MVILLSLKPAASYNHDVEERSGNSLSSRIPLHFYRLASDNAFLKVRNMVRRPENHSTADCWDSKLHSPSSVIFKDSLGGPLAMLSQVAESEMVQEFPNLQCGGLIFFHCISRVEWQLSLCHT